jgi:hypothetical protein
MTFQVSGLLQRAKMFIFLNRHLCVALHWFRVLMSVSAFHLDFREFQPIPAKSGRRLRRVIICIANLSDLGFYVFDHLWQCSCLGSVYGRICSTVTNGQPLTFKLELLSAGTQHHCRFMIWHILIKAQRQCPSPLSFRLSRSYGIKNT